MLENDTQYCQVPALRSVEKNTGRAHSEIGFAAGCRLGRVHVRPAFANLCLEPGVAVKALFKRRVISGELKLVFPFELQRDLLDPEGWRRSEQTDARREHDAPFRASSQLHATLCPHVKSFPSASAFSRRYWADYLSLMFICKCRKWDASNSSRKGLQRRPNSCVTTVRFYGGMNQVIALMKPPAQDRQGATATQIPFYLRFARC